MIAAFVGMIFSVQIANAQLPHWQQIEAPYSAHVTQISFLNEQYGFAEADFYYGSLFRTTDSGNTWLDVTQGFNAKNFYGGGNIFFLTPSHLYRILYFPVSYWQQQDTDAIYESLDSGVTWKKITPQGVWISDLYAAGDTVWAGGWIPRNDGETAVRRTTNDGQTWTNVPGGYYSINGNRGGLLMSGILNKGADFSSNGGSTWINGKNLPTASGGNSWLHSAFLKPGTSDVFVTLSNEQNPNNWGTIWVSTDAGSTFHETDTTPGWNFGEIEGASGSCAPLYMREAGDSGFYWENYQDDTSSHLKNYEDLLRSTDQGQTWQHILDPLHYFDKSYGWNGIAGWSGFGGYYGSYGNEYGYDSSADVPGGGFSVVGRGAVVLAVDDSGRLWKTTDGGDGTLGSSVLPVTMTSFSNMSGDALANGDTIVTKVCDSVPLYFNASFTGCDRIWIDTTTIDNIAPNGYYSVLDNQALTDGSSSDSSKIVLRAVRSGIYPITIHGRLRREDFIDDETTIHLTLIVKPDPAALTARPTLIDFGTESLCAPKTLTNTIGIRASDCEITIDSIVFHPRIGGNNFSFIPITKEFALGAGDGEKKYPVSYLASLPEPDSGLVLIYSSNGIDTIPVRGAGAENSRSFVAATDTARASLCDSSSSEISITNTTCGILFIDSLTLPNDLSIPNISSQLPLGLSKGTAGSITLSFTPSLASDLPGKAQRQVTAHIRLIEIGDTLHFDTVLIVQTVVIPGVSLFATNLPSDSLNFRARQECEGGDTLSFSISNKGCDTLSVQSVALSGGTAFSYSVDTTLPVQLLDGSVSVTVRHPQLTPGVYSGGIAIHYTLADGTQHDTTIFLSLTVTKAARSFAMDTMPIDLGTLTPCTSRDTEIGYTNTSCVSATVIGWTMSDWSSGYNIFGTGTHPPYAIAPGASDSLHITFDGSHTGVVYDTAIVWFGSDSDSTRRIPLKSFVPAIDTINFTLFGMPGTLSAGQSFTAGVYPEQALSGKGITSVSGVISWRRDDFDFGSWSGLDLSGNSPYSESGRSRAVFTVSNPSGLTLDPTKPLAQISLRAMITDTISYRLYLDSLVLGGDAPQFSACSYSTRGKPDTAVLTPVCPDSILINDLAGRGIMTIAAVQPNPASDGVTISFRGNALGPISYDVIDALGGTRLRGFTGENALTLDVSSLPQGVYFFRAASGNSLSSSIQLVILR